MASSLFPQMPPTQSNPMQMMAQLQQFAAILNSGGSSAPDSAPDESGPKKAR